MHQFNSHGLAFISDDVHLFEIILTEFARSANKREKEVKLFVKNETDCFKYY